MSDNLIIHGPPLWSPIVEISLGKQIYDSLIQSTKKEIAFIDAHTGKATNYKDFFIRSCQLARSLQNCGYEANDVISISSENNNNFFIPVVSALYLGIVVAPLNHTYTEGELLHSASITKPKVVFCSKNVVNAFKKLKDKVEYIERIIILDENHEKYGYNTIDEFISKYCDKDFFPENFIPIDLDPFDHLAVVLCSSGTTGLPKGVMTTHDNISMRINHIYDPRIHRLSHEVQIGILPFFHGYGFMTSLSAIIKRNIVVVLKRFEGDLFLKCIQKYRISSLFLVPPLMLFLSKSPLIEKYDLSSIVEIISGAAPLSMATEVKIRQRLPNVRWIRQGYGLTEATLAVLMVPLENYKTGSSGKVVPGMACVIRDPETGHRLGPNEVGELCFKGRMITKGYYGNEEATKSTFSLDGWLYTGDLGYYDDEHYFFIVDRLKELIKYKGFQVPPAELEGILIKHPEIIDVGVVGKPDEEAGELATAFVVKAKTTNITEEEIRKYVAAHVSKPKQLHGGVYFVDEIPKNASGKILRRQLRNFIAKQTSKL